MSFRTLIHGARYAYHTPTRSARLPAIVCSMKINVLQIESILSTFSTTYPQKLLTHSPRFHWEQAAWLCYNRPTARCLAELEKHYVHLPPSNAIWLTHGFRTTMLLSMVWATDTHPGSL